MSSPASFCHLQTFPHRFRRWVSHPFHEKSRQTDISWRFASMEFNRCFRTTHFGSPARSPRHTTKCFHYPRQNQMISKLTNKDIKTASEWRLPYVRRFWSLSTATFLCHIERKLIGGKFLFSKRETLCLCTLSHRRRSETELCAELGEMLS